MKTRFANHAALAELPYFRINEAGNLSLALELGYSIIDAHTHLALSYGGIAPADLKAASPRTLHYLPVESALDLEGYVNSNIDPVALKALRHDLTLRSLTSGGMRATHTAPNLIREMREMGYGHAVLLPIELPVLSDNASAYLGAVPDTGELIAFGSVHPLWPRAGEILAEQKKRGIRGVKLHPAVQLFAPDGERAMRIYRLCADLDLPILIHSGPVGIETGMGRNLTQMNRYEAAVRENPRTTFVLGHAGARQPEIALALAQKYPNVWLELSGQGIEWVRRILAEAPRDRLVLGSDWPFYHLVVPLVKLLMATEDDAGLRRAVLRDNAARLLRL